jgi:hypothetical protein
LQKEGEFKGAGELFRFFGLLCLYPANPDKVLLATVAPPGTLFIRLLYRIIGNVHFLDSAHPRTCIKQAKKFTAETTFFH